MSSFSSRAVADALEVTTSSRSPKRQPTVSTFSITPTQLGRKSNTKTNVLVVAPRGDERRELNLKWTGSRSATAFDIQRLIPGLNKAGTLYERPDHKNPNLRILNPKSFNTLDRASNAWRLGTFVLVLNGAQDEVRKLRNVYGDEESWSARSLQVIYRPWGLPSTLPLDDEGVPLKIAYPKRDMEVVEGYGRAFEAGEPLLVLTKAGEDEDVMLPVIDFEGYRGEINKLDLYYCPEEVPWGVLVNREWWHKQIDLFNEEMRTWATAGLITRICKGTNKPGIVLPSINEKVGQKRKQRCGLGKENMIPARLEDARPRRVKRSLKDISTN